MEDKYNLKNYLDNWNVNFGKSFGFLGLAAVSIGMILDNTSMTIGGGGCVVWGAGTEISEYLKTYVKMRADFMRDQIKKLDGIEKKLGDMGVTQ
jgi:hypothetical protein